MTVTRFLTGNVVIDLGEEEARKLLDFLLRNSDGGISGEIRDQLSDELEGDDVT